MKRMIRFSFLLLTIAALSILHSCQKEDGLNPTQVSGNTDQPDLKRALFNTFYGPSRPLGEGNVRAWIIVDKQNYPITVGVSFSEHSLEELPVDGIQMVLRLPEHKGQNFYTHVLLDWNPQGHEPAGVYDLPHFDIHFYTISSAKRLTIPLLNPPVMDAAPEATFIPPLYLQTPGLVPAMGAHWIDLLAPEFNGGTFSSTFIWGSYQGKFIFWEPMVTLDYLKSKPDDTYHLRQPADYEREGWYAQDYKVAWSANRHEYTVALLNLAHHAIEKQ